MQQKILDSRYELERKIGEGGMARVYLARDRRLNRRVAVKVLHNHYNTDPDFLNRFSHEAQAAATLSHPNIVDVYDVGQDGDIHYIVMEYVDGTDLKTVINREVPLAVERAVAIAEAIALGLAAAHRVGLIHRDIKPQNIIVAPDGHVQITDFGVAKSQFSTAMTETGITFGTVDYISPEQAQGLPATPRSDIYSLGVTIYEMLTGRLPFAGDNALAIAMQHVSAPPPPPRRFNSQIPPQLEALILRALAKDPAQRFESAQEFARLLRNYRDLSQQETSYTPNLARRQVVDTAQPRATTPTNGNATIRTSMPPPRPTTARAPSQQNQGCGVFVVGMLILAGVLGLVFLFSTGTLDNLLASGALVSPGPPVNTPATATITPTAIPTPTAPPLALVPNLVNLSDSDAQRLLRESNLVPVTTTASSDVITKGQVISQEVPAQSQIPEGRPVTYTVSLGTNLVTVPVLTQRSLTLARQQAEQQKLTVTVVEEPNTSVTEGFIIRQSPNPGLLLQPGDTVTLVVSIGDKVRFPDIIGKSRAEAEQTLRNNNNFVLEYIDEQGRDRLADFDQHFPGEVVSALSNGQPVRNGDYVPRSSRIVLGVRGP